MKKIFNIILSVCILVATFDIIDVQDITINGTPVFHSEEMSQNQEHDSLEAEELKGSHVIVFNIFPVFSNSINISYRVYDRVIFTDDPEYNFYKQSLNRPPIA